jgi:hypothetical protein
MNTSTRRDTALTVIRIVVWFFLIGAALISFSHIVHVSQMLGLGWESWTVPAFVDGIAIVGKVSMLPRFSAAFRKSGFKLLMFGGVLSLAANVAAGSNWGERGFGVLVVAGFMILESHATKADRTAVAANTETVDPAVAARRSAAAMQAAATRKANADKAAQDAADALAAQVAADAEAARVAEEKRLARNAAARARRQASLAPVSPAPAPGPMPASIHVPTVDEVAALVGGHLV